LPASHPTPAPAAIHSYFPLKNGHWGAGPVAGRGAARGSWF
jgi:hypothetical protein